MPENPFELAEGWPHEYFNEYPDEVHIAPRTAYFKQNGKLMALRLEELTDADVAEANIKLSENGVSTE